MTSPLTVFVSSTIKDFAGVRADLRQWLEAKGLIVRMSEFDDFPIGADRVHSHDTCLQAIKGSHLFILLIGGRFGGKYKQTTKSITWREYEEAQNHQIPSVVVVLEHVNQEAERSSKAKRSGETYQAPEGIDARVFQFIDAVRKQETANWMHTDWNGSFGYIQSCLRKRVNAYFVSYQDYFKTHQRRFPDYVHARSAIDALVALALPDLGNKGSKKRLGWSQSLLDLIAEYRDTLFQFQPVDRYNFVLYRLAAANVTDTPAMLSMFSRKCDSRLQVRNRTWEVGEGHIGQCVALGVVLVSENLPEDEHSRNSYLTDPQQYVSIISIPIRPQRTPTANAIGALVITSDRAGHFESLEQPEVLTAQSMASIISMMGLLE